MPNKKKIYLFANWKMYLDYDESVELAKAIVGRVSEFSKNIFMALFPGSLAMKSVFQIVEKEGVAVGAQDVYWVEKGAYTGAVSAHMFKSAGCTYALIGHSERRHVFEETNQDIRKKIEAALISGMTPVLCVGETRKEREEGKAGEVVEIQLRAALDGLAWEKGASLVVAYEPVWSIGTGLACDPEMAEEMQGMIHEFVKGLLPEIDPVLLYGGSVNPENISDYLIEPHIDGVLVGVASVKIDSWRRFANVLQS